MRSITVIAAIAQNGVIGKDGNIPWKLKDDMRDFVKKTKNQTVLMGRKTYESIIRELGNPLPKRCNIVLSRTLPPDTSGVTVARSWEEALAQAPPDRNIFVMGGKEVYEIALAHADNLSLTKVQTSCEGDTWFPSYNTDEWEITSAHRVEKNAENEYSFTIETYQRKQQRSFVDLAHARDPAQLALMEQIERDGVCPFCPEHLQKYHPRPLYHESLCTVTENMTPYKGAHAHWLIINKRHVERFGELTPEERVDIGTQIAALETKIGIPGLTVLMRSGDTSYTGGSVAHFHVHIIAGGVSKDIGTALRAKIGYSLPE